MRRQCLTHRRSRAGLRQRFRRALKRDRVRAIGMMFHVKQCPQTPCLSSPARGQTNRSRRTITRTTPIARLNHRRKAAGFILRMFQPYVRRPRGVVSPLRLVRPEAETARGDWHILRLQLRASLRFQRSAPIPKTQIMRRTPLREGYFLLRNRMSPGKTGF